jgi:NADH-quinone oxidoreductase subunit E
MCTGRVDLGFILRAFSNGTDGVFIGGCWPGECHYITEGNYLALSTVHLSRKLLELIGVNPARVRLEWVSAAEGTRFAEVMNDFSMTLRQLGPLGKETDPNGLKRKLEAVRDLIPYIKLVERERLRVPLKSEKEYIEFFTGEEFDRLFRELIADKLAMSQITAFLREGPLSSGEISERLGAVPSEVSKLLNSSARLGIVMYDQSEKRFALPRREETGSGSVETRR